MNSGILGRVPRLIVWLLAASAVAVIVVNIFLYRYVDYRLVLNQRDNTQDLQVHTNQSMLGSSDVLLQSNEDLLRSSQVMLRSKEVELQNGEVTRERERFHAREINASANTTIENTCITKITLTEFWAGSKTGNSLIDEYGNNNVSVDGEMGGEVKVKPQEKAEVKSAMEEYHVNTIASDRIPLNRLVPDSRPAGCQNVKYATENLPTVSVIIPFHNEWPSLLLRTVYSVINRSPRHSIREILLVDDGSTLDELKDELERYICQHFPAGLVKVVRMSERGGLIKARMRGCKESKGEVLVFFDSHVEVNIGWLQPLLSEITKDRRVVAMSTLDYIHKETFKYRYTSDVYYGWDWSLLFFERKFRADQTAGDLTRPVNGVTMVGSCFAVDKRYFLELGGYDDRMLVWGGENFEMTWRVWMCGGRLLHAPCSRVGHVARGQPYTFPGGRTQIEHYNYKRAALVWMGNYTRFLYSIYPDMKTLDVGDVSERLALKTKLGCKDFSWYLQNIWPELNVYDENATLWGQVGNLFL
ncbi:polypeptide N-acetylgalactosaminyltransferase 1-like [Physella acuta]|uniref:polypeptide N-acetylgalactosaminyltransferase 1-like n=1 Tax=Physella acuta TaxID=109671 RepID=UPI0027DB0C7B|nr:polypeptide N-acetylgalactosaminyltransferase 1-like [Physella acuta]